MIGFLITVVELVVILGFMIFIHEMGHFIASLLLGIPIEEFGFGYPPKIKTLFTWRGTEFTLNAIPFGGFVRPRGEDDPDVEGGIEQAAPWKRLIVLVSGAIMNLLMAVIVFGALFMQTGIVGDLLDGVLINSVTAGSPAAVAGFEDGDVISTLDGIVVNDYLLISGMIDERADQEIAFEILRGDEILNLAATPELSADNDPQLGIIITPNYEIIQPNFFQAVGYGGKAVWNMIQMTFQIPAMLVKGEITTEEARVSGPVGIGQMLGQAREVDIMEQASGETNLFFANTLWFIGAIAAGLGFANLLPLPALDGGRIVFVLFEMIFRRRIPKRFEATVHAVGFFLLIGISVFIGLNDIFNPINLPMP